MKLNNQVNNIALSAAAAFGRLCVETLFKM